MTTVRMTAGHGKLTREIVATIGEIYRVEPLNPQKTKHRGRVCTLVEFDDDFAPQSATVRFHDTNRRGDVALSNLVPVE